MRYSLLFAAGFCAMASLINVTEGQYLTAFLLGIIAVKDVQIFSLTDV